VKGVSEIPGLVSSVITAISTSAMSASCSGTKGNYVLVAHILKRRQGQMVQETSKGGAMEPTDSEVQLVWEWCGLRFGVFDGLPACVTSDNLIVGTKFPPIDLKNLFEYSVPFVIEEIRKKNDNCRVDFAWNLLFSWWMRNLINSDFNAPALALFWVIWEVRKDVNSAR